MVTDGHMLSPEELERLKAHAAASSTTSVSGGVKDGSQSARVLRWDVQNGMDGVAEVTPGPAAYTFHTTEILQLH